MHALGVEIDAETPLNSHITRAPRLYAAAASPPRVVNVYSIGSRPDRLQAEQMAGLTCVDLVGADGAVHNVVDPLIRSGQLMPLLQRFLAGAAPRQAGALAAAQ